MTPDLHTEAVVRLVAEAGERLARQALAATAEEIEDDVMAWAARHHDQGALHRSVIVRATPDGFEVGTDGQHAPHALFVHWGTRPHRIVPKNKKSLRWAGPNGFAFARGVDHPGYVGDPWLADAAAKAPKLFERHLSRVLKEL